MLERHAEEDPLDGSERRIEPLVEAVDAERECARVGCEGFGSAAMEVSRQLVEQQDEAEPATRRLRETVERTGPGLTRESAEALLEVTVLVGGAREPAAHSVVDSGGIALVEVEPESEQCLDSLVRRRFDGLRGHLGRTIQWSRPTIDRS